MLPLVFKVLNSVVKLLKIFESKRLCGGKAALMHCVAPLAMQK